MKHLLFIVSLILVFSWTGNSQDIDSRIEVFIAHIGKDKAIVFDKLVDNFEKLLENNFQSQTVEDSYMLFLKRISAGEFDSINWTYNLEKKEKLRNLFESSGLREEIWLKPHKVWFEQNILKKVYKYFDEVDTFELTFESLPFDNVEQEDINRIIRLEETTIEFNPYGKYITGLDKIKGNDSTLINYIKAKENGIYSDKLIAKGLLSDKADCSDYFIKRIIVIEFYY